MGVISLLVPAAVQALFGDPPVLRGEEISVYYNILDRFAEIVDPQDTMEWLWIKDLTDHSWEIRRLRRLKVQLVELQRDQWVSNLETYHISMLEKDDESPYVPLPVPMSEKDTAKMSDIQLANYSKVDKLIASAEARRDRTLREIDRRREQLARRVRKACAEVDDGEATAVTRAAA